MIVAFKSLANGRWLCADDLVEIEGVKYYAPGRVIQANRDDVSGWQKFEMYEVLADDTVRPFDPIVIPPVPEQPPQGSLPPPPSRTEILSAPWAFQGLMINTAQFGTLPWFDVAVTSLNDEADRRSVFRQLRAAGSKATAIAVSWRYASPGQPYEHIPGTDLSQDLPKLCKILREAVEEGLYPYLFLAGDGQSPPEGGYSDPNGWTYGYQWVMDNMERIITAVKEAGLMPYVVFSPGFDGVF